MQALCPECETFEELRVDLKHCAATLDLRRSIKSRVLDALLIKHLQQLMTRQGRVGSLDALEASSDAT